MKDPIYYECHMTVEPVECEKLEKLKELSQIYDFKPSTLLMRKSLKNSNLDSFITGKDKEFFSLENKMNSLLGLLRIHNYEVYRYKIEAILLDSKIKKETK